MYEGVWWVLLEGLDSLRGKVVGIISARSCPRRRARLHGIHAMCKLQLCRINRTIVCSPAVMLTSVKTHSGFDALILLSSIRFGDPEIQRCVDCVGHGVIKHCISECNSKML